LKPTDLKAIQEPNAELVTEKIVRILPNGVETADGKIREIDCLILATGFDTTVRSDCFSLIENRRISSDLVA